MNFWVSWPASSSPPDRRNIVDHHDNHDHHDRHPHWLEDREENIDGWGSPSHLLSSTHPLCLCSSFISISISISTMIANMIIIITNANRPSSLSYFAPRHYSSSSRTSSETTKLQTGRHLLLLIHPFSSMRGAALLLSFRFSLESTFRPPSAPPLPPFVCLRLQEIV